jgi:hypothetical protein
VQIPCDQWGNPEKKVLQGRISKKFFAVSKSKLAYFAGGKDLFTHYEIIQAKTIPNPGKKIKEKK